MPNMIVTEVFKSISQGLFGSCIMRTVPLEAGSGKGEFPLANGAISTLFSTDSRRFYRSAWENVYWQWFMELKFNEEKEKDYCSVVKFIGYSIQELVDRWSVEERYLKVGQCHCGDGTWGSRDLYMRGLGRVCKMWYVVSAEREGGTPVARVCGCQPSSFDEGDSPVAQQ